MNNYFFEILSTEMAKYISSCFVKAAMSLDQCSPNRRRKFSQLVLSRVTDTHDGKTAGRMEKQIQATNMSLLNTERIYL
jgi:hypothetical protein